MTGSSSAGAAIAAPSCQSHLSQTGNAVALTLFATVIAPGGAPLTARQTEILAHVHVAGGALSTSDVRTRVNEQRRTPLVAEQVYRVLRALQDRGL